MIPPYWWVDFNEIGYFLPKHLYVSAYIFNPPRGPDQRDLCFAPTSGGECAHYRGSIAPVNRPARPHVTNHPGRDRSARAPAWRWGIPSGWGFPRECFPTSRILDNCTSNLVWPQILFRIVAWAGQMSRKNTAWMGACDKKCIRRLRSRFIYPHRCIKTYGNYCYWLKSVDKKWPLLHEQKFTKCEFQKK